MYRILVVEDDLGIGDAVRSLAEKWGLQARCVKNFRDVMEEFNDFDPPSGPAGHHPALFQRLSLVQ